MMWETTSAALYDREKDGIQDIWRWNHIQPEYIQRCIHEIIEATACNTPVSPAIFAWDGEMMYGELDTLSTRLANHLVGLGLQNEDIVPLCFEKSMCTVVAMLGVLKAGAAFAPLDPEHPPSRHEEIFRQTGAKVALASTRYSTLWPDAGHIIVAVGRACIGQLQHEPTPTYREVKPNNIAYVMFTSGSTGVPKGVVLEHGAITTSCLEHGKAFGLMPSTRALQFAAYTFDACITEIIATLIYGGCICIPLEENRRNALAQAINDMNVNWALLTSTVARVLDPKTIPSLKVLILGGEPVNNSDWEKCDKSVEQIISLPTIDTLSSHHVTR